jgi:uncharacterized Fe-S cluster-containing radical SAM superfamily protein
VTTAARAPIAVERLAEEDVCAGADLFGHQPRDHPRILLAGAEPILRRERARNLLDFFEHGVFTFETGCVFTRIDARTRQEQAAGRE